MSDLSHLVPPALIDSIFFMLRQRIAAGGLNEVDLPPSETQFSEKKLGIEWTGTLTLTQGKFRGLETVHSVSNPVITLNDASTTCEILLTLILALTQPTVTYDFHLVFMKHIETGLVTGTIATVTFDVGILLSLATGQMRLVAFKFRDIGEVVSHVQGMGRVLDFLASKIVQNTLNRVKWDIATTIEAQLRDNLREVVAFMTAPVPPPQITEFICP